MLELLRDKLEAGGSNQNFSFAEILNRYDFWARKKIKNLTAIDFLIVTEGIVLEAKILTCDLKMYRSTKTYYENIYFMTDKVDAQESDLARLIRDMQLKKNS